MRVAAIKNFVVPLMAIKPYAGLPRYFTVGVFSRSSEKNDTSVNATRKAKTPVGRLDDHWEGKKEEMQPQTPNESDAYAPFPDGKNPQTGEIGGPRGPEPTRYGDWERKGRVIDF